MSGLMRKTPLKRTPFRRHKPRNDHAEDTLARDMAWALDVKARDRRCTFPHALVGIRCWGRLEAHHLIHRRHKATRWDPDNGTTLCSRSHAWVTDLEGGRELVEQLGLTGRPGAKVKGGRVVPD